MPKTLNPQWREQFDFHLYEERGGIIDITAWDKDAGKRDDFIGRFVKTCILFTFEMTCFALNLAVSSFERRKPSSITAPLSTENQIQTMTSRWQLCLVDGQDIPIWYPEIFSRCQNFCAQKLWELEKRNLIWYGTLRGQRTHSRMESDLW